MSVKFVSAGRRGGGALTKEEKHQGFVYDRRGSRRYSPRLGYGRSLDVSVIATVRDSTSRK